MSTYMSNKFKIGYRLREERDRLCFSQALFAGKMGVSRMSQVNYETGKRSPDAEYLFAASEAGVDIAYVITGIRSKAPDFYRMATVFVLERIQLRTGFAEDILSFVIEAIADAATSDWLSDQQEMQERPDVEWDMSAWIRSPGLDEMIGALLENGRLLRDVFGAVNAVLVCYGEDLRLSGAKRVSLVLMLYRAFRSADKVDHDVVYDAVRLAAARQQL